MPDPDTIRLILTIGAFVLLLGMVFKTFYGVISYLIIMMVRPSNYFSSLENIRVELIVGLLVIGVMVLSPTRVKRLVKLPSNLISKRMFILFGVMLVSMVQAFDFETSLEWMIEFFKVFVFFLMIVTLIDDEKEMNIFLWVFVIVTCSLAYNAIYNFHNGIFLEDPRLDYAVNKGGMGGGHVGLSNLILQGMPFAWYLSIKNRNVVKKLFGFLLFFVMLYGVIVSGSRGGFVGLVVMGICVTFFSKRKILPLAGMIVVLLAFLMFSSTGYINYLSTLTNVGTGSGATGEGRWVGLVNGFEMMVKRPILGVGPGCYPVARRAWFGWGLWAHNHYGELMGDLGLVGVWAWFAFLVAYMKKAIKWRGNGSATSIAILTGVIVSTIVRLVVGMGSHSVYIFFWYMVAGLVLLKEIDTSSAIAGKKKSLLSKMGFRNPSFFDNKMNP